jgi:hypothetical protein
MAEEFAIVEEVGHPMEVNDVGLRQLTNQISAPLGSIIAESLVPRRSGLFVFSPIGRDSTPQLPTSQSGG